MSFGKLLAKFEAQLDLPVNLSGVAEWIKGQGIRDEIEFVGVDLDVSVIRGFLYRYRYHKGGWTDATYAAEIHYDREQPPEWINMVIAKELVHLMDRNVCAKKEDFDQLVERLSLPLELKHMLEDPAFAAYDKFGDAFAAALLLPLAARELLMPAYKLGVITEKDIGEMAEMPVKYVRMVMSDVWEPLYEKMKGL